MDKFICVRLVQVNALDLTLFQFDFDLTFAVFFLNADKTVYGRFGSRSDNKDATRDISMKGFRQALSAALELHEKYPHNKAALTAKRPASTEFKRPVDYPSLQDKYTAHLDYESNVSRSCIHCHQVRDAERLMLRIGRKPVPDEVIYTWPMPDVVGLSLDRDQAAQISSVEAGSPAAKAGFEVGDAIVSLNGQPLVSIADVQWVLHNAGETASLKAQVRRGGALKDLEMKLPRGWRRQGDISWRVSTWELRRMATGGLVLEDMSSEARREAGLTDDSLALHVKHVGQYGAHAVAKKAGIRKDDIIVAFDRLDRRVTESGLLTHVLQHRMVGEEVLVEILRGDKRRSMKLRMQ